MKNNDLYLTDRQYLDLMKKIRKDLDSINRIFVEDSTQIGNKYTVSNIGLCAGILSKNKIFFKDKYVTRETALWPKDFDKIGKTEYEYPQQFTRKYRKVKQKCPLDKRTKPTINGCFYSCKAFHDKNLTLEKVKKLYDKEIEKWENK